MQFVRADESLMHEHKQYFQCLVITSPQNDPRYYGILAADALPRELYDALRHQHVIEVPYTGKLYTEDEIRSGAWKRDL